MRGVVGVRLAFGRQHRRHNVCYQTKPMFSHPGYPVCAGMKGETRDTALATPGDNLAALDSFSGLPVPRKGICPLFVLRRQSKQRKHFAMRQYRGQPQRQNKHYTFLHLHWRAQARAYISGYGSASQGRSSTFDYRSQRWYNTGGRWQCNRVCYS